jgi:uncharacterized protein (DUF1778 family)
MITTTNSDAQVDFRLSGPAKAAIEEAAALTGQSLSEFAVSTLLQRANEVLEAKHIRTLSQRDAAFSEGVGRRSAQPSAPRSDGMVQGEL